MATFEEFGKLSSISVVLPPGLTDDSTYLEMIAAGQEVARAAIARNAQRHVRTGSMASKVKAYKPKYSEKSGNYIGFIGFSGKDSNGFSNAQKALWLEFGTRNFPADPMVRSAMKSCENAISTAMQQVFEKKTAAK
jgi:HK97 gp10 family phage protein